MQFHDAEFININQTVPTGNDVCYVINKFDCMNASAACCAHAWNYQAKIVFELALDFVISL